MVSRNGKGKIEGYQSTEGGSLDQTKPIKKRA